MVSLRPATMNDWARLLEWRNDPTTRQMFVNTDPVSLEDHLAWLTGLIQEGIPPFIITLWGEPVGTCRVDKEGGVSIAIDARRRQHGTAAAALGRLVDTCAGPLTALIKKENYASLRLFSNAGFKLTDVRRDGYVVMTTEVAPEPEPPKRKKARR